MSSKSFLLEECSNVKELLDRTLRHDYGIDSSRPFYDECLARLNFITTEIGATDEFDVTMLATWSWHLDGLAALICRIERSSLGEYSWPFVEELKKIASAICRETTLVDPNSPPEIYVFAEGGLSSYAIYTERSRPSASQRRLLTIVFPKSIKNFVLLHTILGHELGHAIWQVSKHRSTLNGDVISHLLKTGGPLQDPNATAAWLYSAAAPQEVKDHLAYLHSKFQIDQTNIFNADIFRHALNWNAWVEEILCDLIGLVSFGPGFVAAHSRLLYSVEPSGVQLMPNHPPVAWRVNMILAGAKILGFDALPDVSSPLRTVIEEFWQSLESKKNANPWCDFIPTTQLHDALLGVKKLLDANPPSSYVIPTSDCMTMLVNKIVNLQPPTGNMIDDDFLPKSENIDFRHIIYAGWIATAHNNSVPFKRINQLCEHAIMQQGAIEMALSELNP